jgi:hypothetical protein
MENISELQDSVRTDDGELPEGNFQIAFKNRVGLVAYVRTGKYMYKSVVNFHGELKNQSGR